MSSRVAKLHVELCQTRYTRKATYANVAAVHIGRVIRQSEGTRIRR